MPMDANCIYIVKIGKGVFSDCVCVRFAQTCSFSYKYVLVWMFICL